MDPARRLGRAAGVLAAVAAISPAQAEEVWGQEQPAALVVVPRGGGVFVEAGWWESCHLLMVSGRRRVPLRAERPPRWGLVLYRPVRALEPGVVYQVVAVETGRPGDDEACAYFGHVVAGAAVDTRPPYWLVDPEVVSTRYRSGCLMDEAIVELKVRVADDSLVRLVIEARPRDGRGDVMRSIVQPRDGRARVEWPASGVRFLRAGAVYEVTVCAEDVAGNRSCARSPAEFTVPGPPKELATKRPEVVKSPPPDERMPLGRAPERRADWWSAGAGAAGALVVLLLVGLARRRVYWSWWTRM